MPLLSAATIWEKNCGNRLAIEPNGSIALPADGHLTLDEADDFADVNRVGRFFGVIGFGRVGGDVRQLHVVTVDFLQISVSLA